MISLGRSRNWKKVRKGSSKDKRQLKELRLKDNNIIDGLKMGDKFRKE